MLGLYRSIFAFLFLVSGYSVAAADIYIHGIRIECDSCRKLSDGECVLDHGFQPALIRCERLLKTELERMLRVGVLPDTQKVFRLLAIEGVSNDLRALGVRILLSSHEAHLSPAQVDILLERFPQLVFDAASEAESWNTALESLFQNVSARPTQFPSLFLTLARSRGDNPLAVVIDVLRSFELEERLRLLSLLAEQPSGSGAELAPGIIRLRDVSKGCLGSFSRELCTDAEDLSPVQARFVYSLLLDHALGSDEFDPVQLANRLAELVERDYQTPRVLALIEEALVRHKNVLSPGTVLAFHGVMRKQERNSASLQDVWIRLALEAHSKALSADAERFLIRAVEALPGVLPESEMARELISQTTAEDLAPWRSTIAERNFLVNLLSGLALLLLICLLVFFFWRRKTRAGDRVQLSRSQLEDTQLSELSEALRDLGLPLWANDEDLRRKYRRYVRELHPDTGHGSVEAFMKLQKDYKRAAELIK